MAGTVVCQGKAIYFKHIVFDECLGCGEYGLVNGGRIIDDDNATVFKEVSIKMLKGLLTNFMIGKCICLLGLLFIQKSKFP